MAKKKTSAQDDQTTTQDQAVNPQQTQADVIPDVDISGAQAALEEAMMELIYEEPFYANLTLNMRRTFTTKFPTLAVNVTDEVNLWINPYFFMNLTIPERVDVLKHECLHVINNHFVRFRDLEPQIYENPENRTMADRLIDMQLASELNKGADYAINEFLPKLPREVNLFDKDGKAYVHQPTLQNGQPNPDAGKLVKARLLFVNDLKKQHPQTLNQQNLEYYYEILKKEQQDQQGGKGKPQQGQGQGQPQPGNGGMTLDDHSAWHESDATEDQITEKVKDIVNKAVEQTGDKAMGSVPGGIMQAIQALNHVPKDWRQDIQRFVARSAEIVIENTRKKRNRRYGIVYPGQKIFPKLTIACALDTSGSVDDECLAQFGAELIRLTNMDIKIKIIECDTQVNAVYDFDPKKPLKVHGRGGTRFQPVFERIEKDKMEIDGLIYFTDGECYGENIKRPNYPVLWALTPPYRLNDIKWGSQTKIEIKKKHVR